MISWKIRIERARKRGKFTWHEQELAGGNWRTCAIGERFKPKTDNLETIPDFLKLTDRIPSGRIMQLGYAFRDAVCEDNFDKALRLWETIMGLDRVIKGKQP